MATIYNTEIYMIDMCEENKRNCLILNIFKKHYNLFIIINIYKQ